MKLLISFALMVCSFFFAHAQDADNFDLHDRQLIIYKADTIKQLRVYKYEITRQGKKVDSTLFFRSIFVYGDNGSAIEHQEIVSKHTSTFYTYTCVYNNNNDIVKRSITSDKPEKLGVNFEYEYNNLNRLTDITFYNRDTTSVTRTKRVYDNTGKWVETLQDNETIRTPPAYRGIYMLYDSLFYDANGRLVTDKYYRTSNKAISTYFYEYDGTDEKTVTITEQTDNTQHLISKNRYNRYGLLIQSMNSPFYNPFLPHDEEQTIGKFFYNKDGTLNTYINYNNGKVAYMYKYYYTKL